MTIKPLIDIQGGQVTLNFHPGQVRAWDSLERFIFIMAGTQSGKTTFGPWWLWREIKDKGPGDYLAVTANYDLFKLKMLPEILQVFTSILKIGRFWGGPRILEICDPETHKFRATRSDDPMYARIILRSARAGKTKRDTGVASLESATVNAAWLDEPGLDDFTLAAWEAILRRLSLSQGRVLGTTTLYNLGWLKTEVFERWEAHDPDYKVIQFDSIENPMFPIAEYERARRVLPAWKFDMLYRGRYARPAGMIYDVFDTKTHIVTPFTIPDDWPRYVGVDPGALNTATVWLAKDPEDEKYYIYRETLEGQLHAAAHAQRAKQRAGTEKVTYWAGGNFSEHQVRLDWQHEDIPLMQPTISNVDSQIDKIYQLLKESKLYVFSSCPMTVEQFNTYSRVVDDRGEPTLKIKDKESYHLLDALRYIGTYLIRGDSVVYFGGLAAAFR